ncbi:fluoride efflux transporter FluC [Corynebacterium sphenisci]|uniref:fluoride efflux transporter FluC n=1 Tax=Corynebacterium sphenisci TaxID=191493 RepID=UPI0026E05DD1|nr:CrcB family protein [Corynebacterium sphenisci]MDO5730600.1 CrcB family protein [Corynebacterium sphenisci]
MREIIGAYLLVAAGAAAGAVARVAAGLPFPDAAAGVTVAVNLLGCLAMGWLTPLSALHPTLGRFWPAVGPGLLGGFTTFSAFAVLAAADAAAGGPAAAAGAIAATALGCPVLNYLGARLGEAAIGGAPGRRPAPAGRGAAGMPREGRE